MSDIPKEPYRMTRQEKNDRFDRIAQKLNGKEIVAHLRNEFPVLNWFRLTMSSGQVMASVEERYDFGGLATVEVVDESVQQMDLIEKFERNLRAIVSTANWREQAGTE